MNDNAIILPQTTPPTPWQSGQEAACEVCGCKIKYQGLTWVHQTGDLQPRHIGWPVTPKQVIELAQIAPSGMAGAWW